jgi:hypothetical protein
MVVYYKVMDGGADSPALPGFEPLLSVIQYGILFFQHGGFYASFLRARNDQAEMAPIFSEGAQPLHDPDDHADPDHDYGDAVRRRPETRTGRKGDARNACESRRTRAGACSGSGHGCAAKHTRSQKINFPRGATVVAPQQNVPIRTRRLPYRVNHDKISGFN